MEDVFHCRKNSFVAALYLLTLVTIALGGACDFNPDSNGQSIQCQPVLYAGCKNLGYNQTSYPNIFNHTSQSDTEQLVLSVGTPLLSVIGDCSDYLEHFFCSAVYPICTKHFRRILPCQELCTAVRESCGPSLRENGYDWPEDLDCNLFPPSGSTICVWTNVNLCETDDQDTSEGNNDNTAISTTSNCTGRLMLVGNSNTSSFGAIENCGESCNGAFFDASQQELLQIWITAWSLICLLISIMIVLTYILNFRKIPRLEAPIYYIAVCYILVSLAYTLSIAIGKESLICEPRFRNQFNESSLLVDTSSHPLCLVMFCVIYYFTLCTWSWWIAYTLEWFICSMKYNNIDYKWRLCFHIIAWGIPLVFTLTALSLGHVAGDPSMKTCWIEKHHELEFLVIPLFVAVLFCSVMLVICFARVVNLQRSRNQMTVSTKDSIKPSILIRAGLYCTVYLLPVGLLLCTYFYEFWYRKEWETQYLKCSTSSSTCSRNNYPVFALFMVKIAASLTMGIMSLFWVIGRESLQAWRRACCFCYSSPGHSKGSVGKSKGNMNGKFLTNFQVHNFRDESNNFNSSESSV